MMAAPSANPFVGLRAFDRGDGHLFFGRDEQLDVLTSRLHTQRFVAVMGTSGSGKSSLVRAGLLPALAGGLMHEAGAAWSIATMTPGANPMGTWRRRWPSRCARRARSARLEGTEATSIEATSRGGSLGLVDAVPQARLAARRTCSSSWISSRRCSASAHCRVGPEAGRRRGLRQALLKAVQQPAPVYVMLTMRSEFLGTASEFRGLPEAINDGLFLVPRLTRDELAQAITGPIAVAGGRIAPSLVQRLLNDVGDNQDQLPVLQHALMRTWEGGHRGGAGQSILAIEHYEAVKGLAGALSEHADEAFLELDERQKIVAATIFKALTERGPDGREVRRPTSVGELAEVAGVRVEEIVVVVDRFRREGRSFLLPSGTRPLAVETVLDISHETLMRKWRRLTDWIVQEAEDRRIFLRLSDSAALYRRVKNPFCATRG